MLKCEYCEGYNPEDVGEEFKQRADKDGYCSIIEAMVNGNECVCRKFVEKKNDESIKFI